MSKKSYRSLDEKAEEKPEQILIEPMVKKGSKEDMLRKLQTYDNTFYTPAPVKVDPPLEPQES